MIYEEIISSCRGIHLEEAEGFYDNDLNQVVRSLLMEANSVKNK